MRAGDAQVDAPMARFISYYHGNRQTGTNSTVDAGNGAGRASVVEGAARVGTLLLLWQAKVGLRVGYECGGIPCISCDSPCIRLVHCMGHFNCGRVCHPQYMYALFPCMPARCSEPMLVLSTSFQLECQHCRRSDIAAASEDCATSGSRSAPKDTCAVEQARAHTHAYAPASQARLRDVPMKDQALCALSSLNAAIDVLTIALTPLYRQGIAIVLKSSTAAEAEHELQSVHLQGMQVISVNCKGFQKVAWK